MERKMDFWTIEIPAKISTKKEAARLQKNLYDKFEYIFNNNKDYMGQVIIGISNINSRYVIGKYKKSTGKRGNKRKIIDLVEETEETKKIIGSLYIKWHIHILALTSPSETIARIITKYIRKNWNTDAYVKYYSVKYNDFYINGGTRKLKQKDDYNIGMLFYIAEQSESVLFCGSKDKRFKFTFRQMHEEMVKQYTNKKFNRKYNENENYKNKLDKRFNEMINYFNEFYSDVEKKKAEEEYKKIKRQEKINERYKEIEKRNNDNKVRKNNNIDNNKYSSIIKI